jgi:hypothetical protein
MLSMDHGEQPMTNPTDRPIPEAFAREIAAEGAMLANQVRLMNLVTAVVNPETIFTGGPDGPIREPGDDVPHRSDVYSDEELCAMADLNAARLRKRGLYEVAADVGLLRDALSERCEEVAELVADLERMNKQVQLLAAEKRQAQEWIANLRKSNELYSARISFLEGGK